MFSKSMIFCLRPLWTTLRDATEKYVVTKKWIHTRWMAV